MEQTKERNQTLSWSVFIGAMFIGMGVGSLFGEAGVGTLIGLGVGFIVSAVVEGYEKEPRNLQVYHD